MRFIYQFPETSGSAADMLDAGAPADIAVAVEASGWSGVAFTEHPAPGARWLESGGHQTLDPFVALGHVAAVTHRIRLLTNLAVVPYRNPSLLAKAAASVDRLSNGRLILGVGTGYLQGEFRALGVDFARRNARFDEALDVLSLHWSGQPFSYEGHDFVAKETRALPRPTQRPIPIWIGGNSALSRRRAATRAQGWLPLTSHVDISATVRTPHLDLGDELAARIAEVRSAAHAERREIDVAVAYTDPSIAQPEQDAARHRGEFARLATIGVDWIIVAGPSAVYPASLVWIEQFAANYIDR
jgi:probable F420-dependent oxidoreductase